ncbi:hypothetical protein [Virgisporangium ochraceum]|jgi:hypothetical protein|uniref:Uncharacterized protein n=1 Tax=Virgisporangium ochraceum TaxID=65505 RepID=A0A8J4ECZ5_9ACTN|nr:hypothetical protein [Virgisporangium ochraceum]GIJ67407.1 hypothetical protein Voc01_023240 [Virgisporangium ochraceum]
MFGRTSKTAKAQEIAEDAWDALVSTWESARDRTGDLVVDTGDRVGSAKDEAWRRAGNALDALAGRSPSRPWALVFAAVAAGAALGWVAATAIGRQSSLPAFDAETEPSDLPTTS